MHASYTAAVPRALVVSRPTRATYARRRLGAVTFLVTLVLSLGSMVQHGLADRGSDPASAPTAGHTTGGAAPSYVVQPGDTLGSIAERLYRGDDLAGYVDAMIAVHGGTELQVGELLRLP